MYKLVHITSGLDLVDLDGKTTTFDSIDDAEEARETFINYQVEAA